MGRFVALTAVAGWPQHREIYVVGEHGAVAHGWKWHEDIWQWRPAVVPVLCRDVALSAGTRDLLECFAVGRDQRIRHRWFWAPDEKWTEWATGAGDDAPGQVIALDVLNGWPDHQEIFVVRTDGEINHRDHWRGHDWRPWRDLEVPTKMNDVAAGATSEGRLEVIAVARDGRLWQRSYDEQIGGARSGAPFRHLRWGDRRAVVSRRAGPGGGLRRRPRLGWLPLVSR